MPMTITDSTTNQEILDYVAQHLRAQGKQSRGYLDSTYSVSHTPCLYRGKDGLSCAVGCMIPDDMYRPDMERAFSDLIQNFPRMYHYFRLAENHSRYEVLRKLQFIHDDDGNWDEDGFNEKGELMLVHLASNFCLAYTPRSAQPARAIETAS